MKIYNLQQYKIEDLNELCKNTMGEILGIEFIEIGENFIKAKMPINNNTIQPMGLLHGGASAALAETLGSVAANCCLDMDNYYAVGMEINCNHIRSVNKGYVYGITKPIHIGRASQVWEIKITNEIDKLVCISRLTVSVIKK